MGFLAAGTPGTECTPKVESATYTTMVRHTLEHASAISCPQRHKDSHLLEKVQRRAAGFVSDQQLHGQVARQCYIMLGNRCEVDKSGTTKTTDSPGDALQLRSTVV